MTPSSLSSFIWSVADLLRGDYRPHEYGRVILPFTVLRRLDCVLAPTRAAVLKEKDKREAAGVELDRLLVVRNEVEHAAALLKERRTTPISAAVTGQVDVRGLAEVQAM